MKRLTKMCEMKEIYEYLGQAIRVTDRAGIQQAYLRYGDKHGNDEWRICDAQMPFQTDFSKSYFQYIKVTTEEDEDGNEIEVKEEKTSCLKYELNMNWRWACQTFEKTVFR